MCPALHSLSKHRPLQTHVLTRPMEDNLNSSEAFAKALKGFQTSASEKIRLAREAWDRADVILPHKQEFLLEWLCSALVKSSTPSKNPKDASP